VVSGAGLFLAIAGAVFVFFPHVWPQPAAVAPRQLAAAAPSPGSSSPAALPAAVGPLPQQVVEAQPRTAAGRADAMPMTAVIAAPPPMPSPVIQAAATDAGTGTETAGEPAATARSAPPLGEEQPAVEQVSLAGAHAIYLSSFPDRELAESGWQILERRYAKGLTGLKPQIVEGRGSGGKRVWRLFAGPLGSAVDAAQRCRALAFGSVNCKPADFTRGATGASGAWEG
jgi:hypothetical protein